MTVIISGSSGITTPTTSTTGEFVTSVTGFKNRIINGAMVIDQRNAGASVSVGTATGTYTLDRWRVYHDTAITSNITAQQSTTVPTTGYINSQILTNGTGASPASGDLNVFQQRIEGYNVADLNFGSSTASAVTLSFWVRSSLTGTFGVGLSNSAQDRSVASTYTINSANTWEQKTITFSGDQSGTWVTNNGIGLITNFDLGSGTTSNATTAGTWQAGRVLRTSACTNFIGTTGATFYITGVQLEKGSTATSFDYRPFGTELALCQRYFQLMDMGYVYGFATSGNQISSNYTYPVAMRATPTIAIVTNPTFGSGTAVNSYQTTARMTAFYMITNGAGYATWVGGQFSAAIEL
jgi:hypothetical protein